MVGTHRVETVPVPQLRALIDFLNANPGLRTYLEDRNIGFAFDSAHAKSQGGGVFHNGNVHLYGLESLAPDIFLRLAVHEAGHGTYQRMLLPGQLSPPLSFWEVGTGAELQARLDRLQQAAEAERVDLTDPRYAADAQDIQQQLDPHLADGWWNKLSDDARRLYQAWATLRQNDGQYLQGIDLGPGKSEAQRRKYQAVYFSEFCAETFMLVATADINEHLERIATDATVPENVREAWATAVTILDKYAEQRVLGRPSAFG
jgi:hypothetical protein